MLLCYLFFFRMNHISRYQIMRYLWLCQKVLMSHSYLSHIIDISNIWNSNNHRIKIIHIMRSTALIENINWRRCLSMITINLMINQCSSIWLLYLWVDANKLCILIRCRSLTIILIATIWKTSYMICVI